MFRKKEESNLNYTRLNKLISLGHSVLKVLFFVLIVAGIYVATIVLRDTGIIKYLFIILGILSPLFIGIVIAWLFDPIVTFLNKKGLRRSFGAAACYLVLFIIIFLVLNSIIPLLADQINEFVSNTIPGVIATFETWINIAFDELKSIEGFDVEAFQGNAFAQFENIIGGIVSALPDFLVSFVTGLFSGIGVFVIGLIIGFMLLIDFDKHSSNLFNLFPRKQRKNAREIAEVIDSPLRNFVKGALIDSSVVFVLSSIAFSIIGLESPIVFALFCAITNIIPYAGPYIGGAPAVLVGLTQSIPIGLGVLITVAVLQFIEGNFLQPFIMSKTTKVNPVLIISGLLVFGYFFGILGMILSTPILATIKELFTYFNNKYELINIKVD